MNVKKLRILLFLFSFLPLFLWGCGKKESEKSLPKEFLLEKTKEEEGTEPLENVLFDELVVVAKVSSLAKDSSGSSLGYILSEQDTESLISLLQEGNLKGIEIGKEEYSNAMKSALSGFRIEFLDSLDQFGEGVARISCITNKGTYYMNILKKGESAKNYRFFMPDRAVDFLNEKSAEHYEQNSSNPGWFDKAFK